MERKIRFLTDISDSKQKALLKQKLGDKRYSLLHQFIIEKYLSYEEPQRKGTPKGDPIGFSKKKYLASLLMLTNYKRKDIAKQYLGISYGLLRKWGTEYQFKETILQHCAEFIQSFIGYIFLRINTQHVGMERLMRKTLHEISKIDLSHYRSQVQEEFDASYNRLSDSKEYSNLLTSLLIERLMEYTEKELPNVADKNLTLEFTNEIASIISIIRHYQSIPKSDEVIKKEEEFKTNLRNLMINILIDILSKPKISSNERKNAIIALKHLKLLKGGS
jgi:hypothetical protein